MIKVERKPLPATAPAPKFPFIAAMGSLVILVSSHDTYRREYTGTVLEAGFSNYLPGFHRTTWNADEFVKVDDIITLQNV